MFPNVFDIALIKKKYSCVTNVEVPIPTNFGKYALSIMHKIKVSYYEHY